jgi:hypothetical protein
MRIDPTTEAGQAYITQWFGDDEPEFSACKHCGDLFTDYAADLEAGHGECEDCAAIPHDFAGQPEGSHWAHMGSCV